MVEKQLPCGHYGIAQCKLKPEEIKCSKPCERFLDCEHRCTNLCGEECSKFCEVQIKHKLVCGHREVAACGTLVSTIKCTTQVTKQWPICDHRQVTMCYVDTERELCRHPCNTKFEECGHKCEGTCGSCKHGESKKSLLSIKLLIYRSITPTLPTKMHQKLNLRTQM